jgi:uncharacterized membrane protein YciS (DUF1049 family)
MRWLRRLIGIALFVAALVVGWRFAHANDQPVFVDYLLGDVSAPGWAVLGATFALGVVVTALVAFWQAARLALLARRYRRLASGLEAEVHQLRNLPLAPAEEGARGGAGRAAAGDAGRSP